MNSELPAEKNTVRALAASADHALDQLDRFIAGLSDEQYSASPPPSTSSIGAHVRHTLDHYASLLFNKRPDQLDYDDRERGGAVETDVAIARDQLTKLRDALRNMASNTANSVRLTAVIAADGGNVNVATSFERELLFVFSHTVHHCALMAFVAQLQGAPVPEDFGYAPATLHFLNTA